MGTALEPLTDLGLSYEDAMHGIKTATEATMRDRQFTTPTTMRVGIDMGKSDQYGLACLLIEKGLITVEEYAEAVRLAANHELAMREAEFPGVLFR